MKKGCKKSADFDTSNPYSIIKPLPPFCLLYLLPVCHEDIAFCMTIVALSKSDHNKVLDEDYLKTV